MRAAVTRDGAMVVDDGSGAGRRFPAGWRACDVPHIVRQQPLIGVGVSGGPRAFADVRNPGRHAEILQELWHE